MSLVRRVARPLLAASFVATGVDSVLHPLAKAEAARPLAARIAPVVGLPAEPEQFVRVNGGLLAGAGVLLALGRLPRLSSLALVVGLVPTAYGEHGFWREKDPQTRRADRTLFLRDLGLLGGALLAAVDTEGRPGLAWRGRRAVADAEQAGRRARRSARRSVKAARRTAKPETAGPVRRAVGRLD